MEQINVKRLSKTSILPKRATNGSAGYDLYADIQEAITINPTEIVKVPTGIAIEITNSFSVGLIYARSGLATKFGVAPANCVGVIDSDYRGEISVALINNSSKSYTISPNERIAQLVFAPVYLPSIIEVDNLTETLRGENGFGSTGKL